MLDYPSSLTVGRDRQPAQLSYKPVATQAALQEEADMTIDTTGPWAGKRGIIGIALAILAGVLWGVNVVLLHISHGPH